jgi:hypothetical protein
MELTQKVVPTVYDVTPEPENRQILEVDMNDRMIGDWNLFAAGKMKFHQKLVNMRVLR